MLVRARSSNHLNNVWRKTASAKKLGASSGLGLLFGLESSRHCRTRSPWLALAADRQCPHPLRLPSRRSGLALHVRAPSRCFFRLTEGLVASKRPLCLSLLSLCGILHWFAVDDELARGRVLLGGGGGGLHGGAGILLGTAADSFAAVTLWQLPADLLHGIPRWPSSFSSRARGGTRKLELPLDLLVDSLLELWLRELPELLSELSSGQFLACRFRLSDLT
mmetsp:Transcript_95852/g.170134  ORF Transcript_95852/g.170134 Transcript_95852/m.170134 type:complete len:221 (-) Transcript_95852:507-1169(-)